MPSLAVVPDRDPFKQRRPSFSPGGERHPIDQFAFERGEETLGWRVVIAVVFAAHTTNRSGIGNGLLIVPARILAATVAMAEQTASGFRVRNAIWNASRPSVRSMGAAIAQPTTRRE